MKFMEKFRYAFLVSVLLFPLSLSGQLSSEYQDYYRQPMDGTILLSGNFAETRSNHFHSGLDMRTGGVEGEPIYAVADGHISRIGVSPYGFGRVLYVAHPNGTTTVYAHMQKFTNDVEGYVNSERYRLRRHSVDLYPSGTLFSVKKGDLIGYSGNSGSSGGPHLHFEVRESGSQRPLNVAKMDIYKIRDDIYPRIVRLYVIETDTVNRIPIHSTPSPLQVKRVSEGEYLLTAEEPIEVGPGVHFVLEATDRKNDTHNTFGIYSLDAKLDGERFFSFKLDEFLFSDTRYVNSLSHYGLQSGSRNELLRVAVQDNNKLPIYSGVRNRGLIQLEDDEIHTVEIDVSDDNNNTSTLSFLIKREGNHVKDHTQKGIPVDYRVGYNRASEFHYLTIPANSLYESMHYTESITTIPESAKGTVECYSQLYNLHNDKTPLHSAVSLAIEPSNFPEELSSKLCFAKLNRRGRLQYAGGKYSDGSVRGTTRDFGSYCVVADVTPPRVTPSFSNGANLSGFNSIYFDVSDDFSGVASYEATIDGEWIVFDHQRNRITHRFASSPVIYNGEAHKLVLKVKDSKGNETVVERTFSR